MNPVIVQSHMADPLLVDSIRKGKRVLSGSVNLCRKYLHFDVCRIGAVV